MPKPSKAYLKRLENLEKARNARATTEDPTAALTSQQGGDTIENSTEVVDEERFEGELPDMLFVVESDDEEEEVSGFQGAIEGEISDEAALETFIKTLQDAQKAAQEEELRKNSSNKRPKHYTGNSERTQYRHAARRRILAADGQTQFITSFFQSSKSGSSLECSPLSGIEYEVLKTEVSS
jgi:hypothetical protein